LEDRVLKKPGQISVLTNKFGVDVSNRLVWACGDVNYSAVASKAALDLICKLLDLEKNKGKSEACSSFALNHLQKYRCSAVP
jgi:hypothetical protein